MQELMETIYELATKTCEHVEVYHIQDCTDNIQLNLYGENTTKAETVKKLIDTRLPEYIKKIEVTTPSEDEVNYCFSGHEFTEIDITVDLDMVDELFKDFIVMDGGAFPI